MPSAEEHMARDMHFLGQKFPEVHKTLDQFAHYPNMEFLMRHRKFLHHEEGVEYIRMRYGDLAAESAIQHIKDDCNDYVPKASDYYDGTVDCFGIRKDKTGFPAPTVKQLPRGRYQEKKKKTWIEP
jgi:hypothetical protein